MSAAPRVSIVLAAYNWSAALRYALESILWQTYQDFEVVVVGDACTDDSEDVVNSFGDPRLRWHNLPENTGNQSGPNNAGLALARGEYIAYQNQDDLWLPNHLEVLVNTLDQTGADMAFTLSALIGPPGSPRRQVLGIHWHTEPAYTGSLAASAMHRRALGEQLGGWRDYRTIQEVPWTDFAIRAYQAGAHIERVHQLTLIKFPSGWRDNVYRDKPTDQHADYAHRIKTDPKFLEQELLDIVVAYALGYHRIPPTVRLAKDMPPGWNIDQLRIKRGLKPLNTYALTPRQRFLLLRDNLNHRIPHRYRFIKRIRQALKGSRNAG